MILTAPAKVNLSLHVVGQRSDGYHLLDSLVVFTEVGDVLEVTAGEALSLTVTGPFAQGVPQDSRNLVWKAAELAGFRGSITLEKHLPHGAGIGGGSSDAAAILRAFGGATRGASLGADVPVCLSKRPQRMEGIGDVICAVPDLPAFHLVLANPGIHMPTPAVFGGLTRRDNAPMGALPKGAPLDWLRAQRNDLEAPAIALAPEVSTCLEQFEDALLARMSGSGATCFGLYDSAASAQRAAARLREAFPGWWVVATRSFPSRAA